MLDRVEDMQTGVLWHSFEGAPTGGVPTVWRSDLVSVVRAFDGCPHPDTQEDS